MCPDGRNLAGLQAAGLQQLRNDLRIVASNGIGCQCGAVQLVIAIMTVQRQ